MTTLEKEHVSKLKSHVDSFSRQLDSLLDDNIMVDEMPEENSFTPITDKQSKLLVDLIHQKFSHKEERERLLVEIQTMSKFDASEFISSLLMGAR